MKNPKTIFLLFLLLFLIAAHCQAQILEIGEPGLGDDGEEGGKGRVIKSLKIFKKYE